MYIDRIRGRLFDSVVQKIPGERNTRWLRYPFIAAPGKIYRVLTRPRFHVMSLEYTCTEFFREFKFGTAQVWVLHGKINTLILIYRKMRQSEYDCGMFRNAFLAADKGIKRDLLAEIRWFWKFHRYFSISGCPCIFYPCISYSWVVSWMKHFSFMKRLRWNQPASLFWIGTLTHVFRLHLSNISQKWIRSRAALKHIE